MKRKVRITKAQLGQSVDNSQNQMMQQEINDQDIVNAVIGMLQNGLESKEVMQRLIDAGVDQAKVNYILSSIEDKIEEDKLLKNKDIAEDTNDINDIEAEQAAITQQAMEDEYRKRLQQMYYSGEEADDTSEEDQYMQDSIIQKIGGQMPSKKSFVKDVVKQLKAEEGMNMDTSLADSTDTGERKQNQDKFVQALQRNANNALMQKDAEAMYDQNMAALGKEMGGRQQRRFNRRVNKLISQIPLPMSNAGFVSPFNVITAPMLGGFSNMQYRLPSFGSYYGGPQLANINVTKTGLFGKPRAYTINFAQEAYYNPTLRDNVIKQEEYNRTKDTKEKIEEKGASENTTTDSDRTGITYQPEGSSVQYNRQVPSSSPAVNRSSNINPNLNYDYANDNVSIPNPVIPEVSRNRSIYNTDYTNQDLYYYSKDRPGVSYMYKDGRLLYDTGSNKWDHEVTDPKRIEELNKTLIGGDLYTLPTKKGYYYRMRADGSYAKFKGKPEDYDANATQIAVIKPGSDNYDYLNSNAVYAGSYRNKQLGGMVDSDSLISKFANGGYENLVLPEVAGKLTNSPYFEEGGLMKARSGDSVRSNRPAPGVTWEEWDKMTPEQKDLIVRVTEQTAKDNEQYYNYNQDYGYNSYAPYTFPGGYTKQMGLPYDPATGETYMGAITPYTDLKKIDVKRSSLLTGLPKKYTMYFSNDDPTAPQFSLNNAQSTTTPNKAATDQYDFMNTFPKDRSRLRRFVDRTTAPIRYGVFNNRSEDDSLGDFPPPIIDPSQENFPPPVEDNQPIPSEAYGGAMSPYLYKAQTGVEQDPRFAPVYTDNPEYVGLSDIDLISSNIVGNTAFGQATNLTGDWQSTDYTGEGTRSAADMATDKEIISDPNQTNRATQKKNLKGDFAVDMKTKNTREENQAILDKTNAGIRGVLKITGERGDKAKMRKIYEKLLADQVYGSTNKYDKGTYETNSGLLRPNEMGFTGIVKYGGDVSYKEGGEHWMSEKDIKRFLEEGGELEFL